MDHPDSQVPEDTRLPEDAAHRLLARAVALDTSRDTLLTLAQLRTAAEEAGISRLAFDQALLEFTTNVAGDTDISAAPRTLWRSAAVNVGAVAAAWLGLTSLVGVGNLIGVGWAPRELIDVIALVGGVAIARRMRARLAQVALLGLGASQAALLVIHLAFGIRSAQGGPTQLAVMAAGLLGATAMVVLGRLRHTPPPHHTILAPDVASPKPPADDAARGKNALRMLRPRLGVG